VDAGGTGSGVPVLLVHGLSMNLAMWRAQVQHLRASRRAAAFDLPGFGQSDPPSDGDYSLAAGVRSIAVVADALGYDRFVLVGHSYSGLLAGKYAAEHHDRIAGVVLADGAFDPSTWPAGAIDTTVRGMRQNWSAAIEKAFTPILVNATDAVRAYAFAAVEATPRESVIATYSGMAGYDARSTLARYPGPKLSIAAAALDDPKAVHHTIPIPVEMMQGVSHWPMMDRPDEFNRLLDAFLAGAR
jgi:pimeloyl-ACP methyl ester carboxylesterase